MTYWPALLEWRSRALAKCWNRFSLFVSSTRPPALSSLVVGAKTGTPGKGFIAAENVPLEQAAVFEWSWLDRSPPTVAELEAAVTRLPSNGRSLEDLKREVTESAG